jgi:cytoskeletal protein RodZ
MAQATTVNDRQEDKEPQSMLDLRHRRQKLGMSPQAMAQGLGLSVRQFECLEAGDWQALPGAAFVRSVLFAYARRLGLDDRDLLEKLLPEDYRHHRADLHADTDHRRIKPKGLLGFAHGGSGSVLAWCCLILSSAVVLIHFFGRQ